VRKSWGKVSNANGVKVSGVKQVEIERGDGDLTEMPRSAAHESGIVQGKGEL
jgi:hypothetical protein